MSDNLYIAIKIERGEFGITLDAAAQDASGEAELKLCQDSYGVKVKLKQDEMELLIGTLVTQSHKIRTSIKIELEEGIVLRATTQNRDHEALFSLSLGEGPIELTLYSHEIQALVDVLENAKI